MSDIENDEHKLNLIGLKEENPRDFMAAIGLLRLFDILWSEHNPALSWDITSHTPIVKLKKEIPSGWSKQCVDGLKELVNDGVLSHGKGKVIKTDPKTFADATNRAKKYAGGDSKLASLPQLLYSSYSSQRIEESNDVSPTWFSFGNGQGGKNLLYDVSDLIQRMEASELESTLFGLAEPISDRSFRWNPAEFRPAAYRSHDPGSSRRGDEVRDYPSLNILAFVGMSFFHVVATSKGSATLGFVSENQGRYFRWPIWQVPLSVVEVQTLLHSDPANLTHPRGITRIWKSKRFDADKSLYFAPAQASL